MKIEKMQERVGEDVDFSEWNFVSKELISWFLEHKRLLPWRETVDPYKIWISEIILQQTRVNQGLDYYLRFIERFPTVQVLADADESDVLKCWQGLGYYSRARNLHATAKIICTQFQGIFPNCYQDVLSLKGVGEYTAAAIVSFAWNQPYPVVDGNVFRFLSRLLMIDVPIDTGKGKKLFTDIAGRLMDKTQAGLYNQAIMEFGALQCVPSSPNCSVCPFVSQCFSYATAKVANYPVKQGKTQTEDRYLYYFHIRHDGDTYLNKRQGKGIWQNLYEFPLIESIQPLSYEELMGNIVLKEWFNPSSDLKIQLKVAGKKHVLSHRILYADFYEINFEHAQNQLDSLFLKLGEEELDQYPVHRLMQFYLEKL